MQSAQYLPSKEEAILKCLMAQSWMLASSEIHHHVGTPVKKKIGNHV